MTCPEHPRLLLEGLREQSIESIPIAGLFSPEFQQWHASVLEVLRQHLRAESIVQEFERLQFEWSQEALESLYASQQTVLKNTEAAAALQASKDLWIEQEQRRRFLRALQLA